jgi:hypothetical protein
MRKKCNYDEMLDICEHAGSSADIVKEQSQTDN